MSPTSRIYCVKLTALAVVSVLSLGLAGCDELKARRKIQDGNRLYNEGRFGEAADVYEQALEIESDIEIGQHNAALANFRAFTPGDDSKANQMYAQQAIGHFEKYLEYQPDDTEMTGFLTTIWLDSGKYELALDHWQRELSKDPTNRDVLREMARINLAAGRHTETVKWIEKRADLEDSNEAKVKAYLDIAKIQWSRLRKPDVVDYERLQAADIGIGALQKASELDPDNAMVQSYLGSLHELRKLAHNSGWARAVDGASERFHKLKWTAIRKKADEARKKEQEKAGGDETTPEKSSDEDEGN